jgi:hypothetical protein
MFLTAAVCSLRVVTGSGDCIFHGWLTLDVGNVILLNPRVIKALHFLGLLWDLGRFVLVMSTRHGNIAYLFDFVT